MSPVCVTQSSPKARKVISTSKPQSVECWNFVNLSEPKQSKDKTLRKFVRSNAMRDYRQKKRQNDVRHKQQPDVTTSHHDSGGTIPLPQSPLPASVQNENDDDSFESCGHTDCIYDCRYSSPEVCSSPNQLLGDGGTDPFDTLPFEEDSQYTGYILKHCELPLHPPLHAPASPIWM